MPPPQPTMEREERRRREGEGEGGHERDEEEGTGGTGSEDQTGSEEGAEEDDVERGEDRVILRGFSSDAADVPGSAAAAAAPENDDALPTYTPLNPTNSGTSTTTTATAPGIERQPSFASRIIRRTTASFLAAPVPLANADDLVMRSPAFHPTASSTAPNSGSSSTEASPANAVKLRSGHETENEDGSESEAEGSTPFPASSTSPRATHADGDYYSYASVLRSKSSGNVTSYAAIPPPNANQTHALSQQHHPPTPSAKNKNSKDPDSLLMALIYGLVNVAVSVPSLYGYAGIIFRDAKYRFALDDLAKLVIWSSAVHQLVFSLRSTMPFAIGQVQDAGLIFLSAMASTIAANTSTPDETVATSLVLLSLGTCLLGLVVVAVGKFRLAKFVSLIPAPVIAGYLGFVGFFCLAAGLGLACDKDVAMWTDFASLDAAHDWVLIAPAIAAGLLLSVVSRRATTWYTLPLVIVGIPLTFYAFLWGMGGDLASAREAGWVGPPGSGDPFYVVFSRFDFSKVRWGLIPRLLPTWLSMCFLVVFASALDIVAVEMDLRGAELDLDEELTTVGTSNAVSGALGGFTGSYIFSQTIFTRRTLTTKRHIGLVLAFVELALFCAPFSLMAVVPRFFFAATLMFISFDLTHDWLYEIAFRVSHRDYALVLITFGAIAFSNDLVFGILFGTGLATLNFSALYAGIDPVVQGPSTSNVMRDYEARKVLVAVVPNRVISLRLSGFLFFGTSTLLVTRVREALRLAQMQADVEELQRHQQQHHHHQASSSPAVVASSSSMPAGRQGQPTALSLLTTSASASTSTLTSATTSLSRPPTESTPLLAPQPRAAPTTTASPRHGSQATTTTTTTTMTPPPPSTTNARRYLVLDFKNVTGIDASAVSTGLMRIRMLTKTHNLRVIFTSLTPASRSMLEANHVLGPGSEITTCDNVNDGLDLVETELLDEFKAVSRSGAVPLSSAAAVAAAAAAVAAATHASTTASGNDAGVPPPLLLDAPAHTFRYPSEPQIPASLLRVAHDPSISGEASPTRAAVRFRRAASRARASFALLVESFFGWGPDGRPSLSSAEARRLCDFFDLCVLPRNSVVFDDGDVPDRMFVVVSGEVVLYKVDAAWHSLSREERAAVRETDPSQVFGPGREIMQRARFGSMFGDLAFVLQQRRTFGAIVERRDAVLFALSRQRLAEMEASEPRLAVGLLKVVGRSLGMTLVNLQAFHESFEA